MSDPAPPPCNETRAEEEEKIMEPKIIELPRARSGPADDLWRIEFRAPAFGRLELIWVDNVPRGIAEAGFAAWTTSPQTRLVFCTDCPPGYGDPCPHGPTLADGWPRGWSNDQVEDMRIMPMREAV